MKVQILTALVFILVSFKNLMTRSQDIEKDDLELSWFQNETYINLLSTSSTESKSSTSLINTKKSGRKLGEVSTDMSFDKEYFDGILTSLPSNNMKLRKTVTSQSRVLLVAGLEGTGHHALATMFGICLKGNSEQLRCELDGKMASFMYNAERNKNEDGRKGLFFAEDAANAFTHLARIENRMSAIAKRRGSHLMIIGLGYYQAAGMLSYPNYNLDLKVLNHPDVFLLAAVAEKVGLDFRVLVLQRDARSILRSTLKRGFGTKEGTAAEARILVDNAAALHTQLRLLDKRFYECLNYTSLPYLDSTTKNRLVDFLHPEILPPYIDHMLLKFNVDSSSTSSNNANSNSNSPAGSTPPSVESSSASTPQQLDGQERNPQRHQQQQQQQVHQQRQRHQKPRRRLQDDVDMEAVSDIETAEKAMIVEMQHRVRKPAKLEDQPANNELNVFDLQARLTLIDSLCKQRV